MIPDLLATYRGRDGAPKLALAIEVDLNNESLKSTFFPKLGTLQRTLSAFDAKQEAMAAVEALGTLLKVARTKNPEFASNPPKEAASRR